MGRAHYGQLTVIMVRQYHVIFELLSNKHLPFFSPPKCLEILKVAKISSYIFHVPIMSKFGQNRTMI